MFLEINRSLLWTTIAITALFAHSQISTATPLGPPGTGAGQDLAVGDTNAEATCTDPNSIKGALKPHLLGTFPRECKDTATHFFNLPMVSHVSWRWKRVPPGGRPGPGVFPLPIAAAPTTCKITLDTLDDPDAEDQFALSQIGDDFRALYNKCISGRVFGPSAGWIPVGPRKVLKLSVGPIGDMVEMMRNSSRLWTLDMALEVGKSG